MSKNDSVTPMDSKKNEKIRFQVTDWHQEDQWFPDEVGDEKPRYAKEDYSIYMFGRTKESESVACIVRNYKPSFFIRIPKKLAKAYSSKQMFEKIILEIKKSFLKSGKWDSLTSLIESGKYVKRMNGYGFTNKKKFTFMEFKMTNMMSFYRLRKLLGGAEGSERYNQPKVDPIPMEFGGTNIAFEMFESNLKEQLLRFIHKKNIPASGWVEVLDKHMFYEPEPEDKESYCTYEFHVDWNNVNPCKDDDLPPNAPLIIASFDIEANSLLDNDTGEPMGPNPHVIQIGTSLTIHGEKEPYLKHVVTLKKSDPIEGAIVESYKREKNVLIAWSNFIRKHDPDIIIGYNIWGYDIAYICSRMRALGLSKTDTSCLGRLNWKHTETKRTSIDSGAFGQTDMYMGETIGRCQIDVLIQLRRNQQFKLDSYTLDDVSEYFLKEKKMDIGGYARMFELYAKGDPASIKTIAEYCIQDTLLPQRLMDEKRLNMLTNLIEMSKLVHVPLQYILNQGQLIKGISLILKRMMDEGYLMPVFERQKEFHYEGGYVFVPQTGFHVKPVVGLDFASLYPSVMILYCLCYTTLVIDDKKYGNIPGVEYDVYDFESNIKVNGAKKVVRRVYKFAREKGAVIPTILTDLWSGRKRSKKLMKSAVDPAISLMYNGKQMAEKVTMNSIYGATGASIGRFPCLAIADVTTYMGRESIKLSAVKAKEKYDCEIVYGDSVSADTPVLLKNEEDEVFIETIDSVANGDSWMKESSGKLVADMTQEKLKTMTESGWTDLATIVKHKVKKRMFRVHTKAGIVDVTEDHSLLDNLGEVVKPDQNIVGTKLLVTKMDIGRGQGTETVTDALAHAESLKAMLLPN